MGGELAIIAEVAIIEGVAAKAGGARRPGTDLREIKVFRDFRDG